MLDPALVERIASDLRSEASLIEKDWHVVRAVGVIATVDTAGMMPAFSGGTSLSKGWQLIKRFSEDIDFKVAETGTVSGSRARRERTAYRERVLNALGANDFEIIGVPHAGNASQFFSADLGYGAQFAATRGLRPHIRVEMSFRAPVLRPIARPIHSLIAIAQRELPEVLDFPCVDPAEAAADKLSALAWRVRARDRTRPNDDPTIIRHLHDLAALEQHVASAPRFCDLVLAATAADIERGAGSTGDTATDFVEMLRQLETDPLWATEYQDFMRQVSFAGPGEAVDFAAALAACRRLTRVVRGLP